MILWMCDSGARGSVCQGVCVRGSVWRVVDCYQGLDVCIHTSVSGCVSV